ncbi:MAG: hypothetical protein Q9218_006787, partial [Villophora microphyllina]
DVPYLIELEQQLLAHHLQGAYFLRVFLRGKIHLPIATLSDLREDLKVSVAESCTALSQIGSFSAKILVTCLIILLGRCLGWRRHGRFEQGLASLAVVYIAEKVKIVIEEICAVLACYRPTIRVVLQS